MGASFLPFCVTKFAWAHNNIGWALYKQGRLDDAMRAYQKALAIDPQLAWAHYNIGTVLQDRDRHDDAMRAFEKALAVDPSFDEAQGLWIEGVR